MFYSCSVISSLSNINHGFFTRNGGVSDGIYASLNCGYGSGDDAHKVAVNRSVVADSIGGGRLCTVHQTHSADCVVVEKAWEYKDAPQADALVTNKPDIILGILTADCLPVLFADSKNSVIGAAHAGWKGAFAGVMEATIHKMRGLGADISCVTATIGPAIGRNSYEVGAEFYERFVSADSGNSQFFKTASLENHHLFDLPAYAKHRLATAGISQINIIAQDTYFNDNEFFSYRRSFKRSEEAYGRQLSVIALRKK